jgi:hypothetical protein
MTDSKNPLSSGFFVACGLAHAAVYTAPLSD